MSRILKEVLAANSAYASTFGAKAELTIPPARRFAILTCMDARMDPAKFAGLAEGDAHVIRNAGGRASDDAIRSLVISHKLLGTQEWFVIHHTDCGMGMFTEDTMRQLLANSLDTATLDRAGWHDTGKGPGSVEGEFIDWLSFKDPIEAVVSDVRRIRAHPLVAADIPMYGYIYDVRSGRLEEVPEAMAIGALATKASPPVKKARRATAKKAGVAATKAGAAATKAGRSSKKADAAAKNAKPPAKKAAGGTAKKSGARAKSRTKAA
jgi:carbonic anhydrase